MSTKMDGSQMGGEDLFDLPPGGSIWKEE